MTQGQYLSTADLNSEFFFSWISCLSKPKEQNLTYVPIAGEREKID